MGGTSQRAERTGGLRRAHVVILALAVAAVAVALIVRERPPVSDATATRLFHERYPDLPGDYRCHASSNDGSVDLDDLDFTCEQTDQAVLDDPNQGHQPYWIDVEDGRIVADAAGAP